MTSRRRPAASTCAATPGSASSSSRTFGAASRSARDSNSGTTSIASASSPASSASSRTASEVLGRAREAHDVPAAGLGAQAALDVGDGAEGVEDRVGVGGRPLVPDRLERGGVHRRVLADLERGEVEAEGLGLPAEVLELAEGQARGAGGDEGVLHGAEVLDEVGGALVAAGVAGASGGEAVRGEAERAPVRRVGQLAGELLGGSREERGVAVEDGAESVRTAGSRAARR